MLTSSAVTQHRQPATGSESLMAINNLQQSASMTRSSAEHQFLDAPPKESMCVSENKEHGKNTGSDYNPRGPETTAIRHTFRLQREQDKQSAHPCSCTESGER